MSEILEILFGTHLTGWKAALQFWSWTIPATIIAILYLRKHLR